MAAVARDWNSLEELQGRFANEADYYKWFVATYRPDKLKVRYDPRFPNQNSTKKCWVNYLDNLRCRKELGKTAPECEKFKRVAEAVCPQGYVRCCKNPACLAFYVCLSLLPTSRMTGTSSSGTILSLASSHRLRLLIRSWIKV